MTGKGPDRERLQSRLEFDPPLHPAQPEPASIKPTPSVDLDSLPLFPQETDPHVPRVPKDQADLGLEDLATDESESPVHPGETPLEGSAASQEVTLQARFLAGLADLAIHGAVVVLLLGGQALLTSTPPSFGLLPAYGVFLLAFSFLYTVVPLAFWGQTPGMSVLGLQVRAATGENLTFPQTAIRWLSGLLTFSLLGLPLLLAATGRSLGDRLSHSVTSSLDL